MDSYCMDPVTKGNIMEPPFSLTLCTVLFLTLFLIQSYTNTELQTSPEALTHLSPVYNSTVMVINTSTHKLAIKVPLNAYTFVFL